MKTPVLVDTSAWVTLLREGAGAAPELTAALEDGRVMTTGPVIAELLQGAREPARVELERRLGAVPFLSLGHRDWFIVGHVAAVLRGRGTPVDLSDIEIAAAASSFGVAVLTADRDFVTIAEAFGDLEVQLVEA